jgi:hypothetical protein
VSNIKTEIIEQLKQDLEYKSDAYCQWLMGVRNTRGRFFCVRLRWAG